VSWKPVHYWHLCIWQPLSRTTRCHQELVAIATSLSTFGPPSNTWFLQPIWAHSPNDISIDSAVFAQMSVECPYTLQWDTPFPPQNCPFPWGSGPPCNTWFLGPTRVLSPNGFSIVLLRFQNFSCRSVSVGFAEKNLGFRFGLGFHNKCNVNFLMTRVIRYDFHHPQFER